MSSYTKSVLPQDQYYDLDGAGIIYPYVATKKWNNIFRIVTKIKFDIDLLALQTAVKIICKEYPYYFSGIRQIGSRYVLKNMPEESVVIKDTLPVCKPFDLGAATPLTRVLYGEKMIALEVFHSLTDGHGALNLLTKLLEEYFRISTLAHKDEVSKSVASNHVLRQLNDIYPQIAEKGGVMVNRTMRSAFQFKLKKATPLWLKV